MSSSNYDLIVVDAMNTLWRSAHAMRALGFEDPNGFTETGAVYGFLEQVISVVNRSPKAIVVIAWEGSREGRRSVMPTYKAHRDDPDETMQIALESIDKQRKILKSILKKTRWGQTFAPGWEADDAMATFARSGRKGGLNTLILSNDTDMLQCLRDEHRDDGLNLGCVHQWKTSKGNNNPVWTAERLFEEKGVTSLQWHEVKALGGDASDGYKGVPGIGEGWACKLIGMHGTLNDVIQAARDGKITKKKADSILENEAYVLQCLDVAKTRDRLKLQTKWGNPDKTALMDIFAQLRFHSINTNNTLRKLV